MRVLPGVCWVALCAAASVAARADWGEPVNGLSVSLSMAPAETGKRPAEAAVRFAIRNGLAPAKAKAKDMSVAIGMLMNARKEPGSFELVSRDADGVLRAVAYTGINGFSGTTRPWVVTLHPNETLIFQEPVTSYSALPGVLAEHRELWVEFRARGSPALTKDTCPGFCWTGRPSRTRCNCRGE